MLSGKPKDLWQEIVTPCHWGSTCLCCSACLGISWVAHHKGRGSPCSQWSFEEAIIWETGEVGRRHSSSSQIVNCLLAQLTAVFQDTFPGTVGDRGFSSDHFVFCFTWPTWVMLKISSAVIYICHWQDICPLPLNNVAMIPSLWGTSQKQI